VKMMTCGVSFLASLAKRVPEANQHPRYAAFIAASSSTAFGHSSFLVAWAAAAPRQMTADEVNQFSGRGNLYHCRVLRHDCDTGNEQCTEWWMNCDNENPSLNGRWCTDSQLFSCTDPDCPQAIPPDPKPDDWQPGQREKDCVEVPIIT
jgi:hypothetical protein